MKKYIIMLACIFTFSNTALAQNPNDMLLSAAINNNMRTLQKALENGANPDYSPPFHLTALIVAAKNKNFKMVEYLVEHGADPNRPANNGYSTDTPLLYAVYNDDIKTATFLLEHGADPNYARNIPLQVKVSGPVQQKRPKGSKIDADYEVVLHPVLKDNGATPLIYAIRKENSDNPSLAMAELLIKHGASVNKASKSGYTPLMATAELQYASRKSQRLQIAGILIGRGADINAQDQSGNTALHYAMATNFAEMSALLKNHYDN